MKIWIFCSLILCSFLSPAQAPAPQVMVILGDSLTEGYGVAKEQAYPSLLSEKIKASGKSWTVLNAGISGSTTASAESRVRWALKSHPNLVLIFLGGNDGLRGFKVSESQKNLEAALKLLQQAKIPAVLCGLEMPPNYGPQYTEDFKRMFQGLAKKYKVRLIPSTLVNVGGIARLNQADGIHPNEAGHKIVAETVYRAIQDLL